MSNSLLIRIVVNLCLIAAMVIQPMVIGYAQGTCVKGRCCQAKTVCHACKCCEVKADGDFCGCCSASEGDAGGCCTSKADQPKHDELFGETSDAVPEPPKANDEDLEQKQPALSSCKCGMRSEPFTPAPQRVPIPQVRDLVVIAYLNHVATDVGLSIRPANVSSRLPIGELSQHFTQRFFCIWRI